MKRIVLMLAIFGMMATTSCKKDQELVTPKFNGDINSLVAPANFNWRTHRDVTFTLSAETTGIVEIKNLNGVVLHRAVLSPENAFQVELGIAAYEEKVKATFLGKDVELSVVGTRVSHNFN